MRACLLLLAVLATFLTFVQVASTGDISTRFITAIRPIDNRDTPRTKDDTESAVKNQSTALTKAFHHNFDFLTTQSSSATTRPTSSTASALRVSKSTPYSGSKSDKNYEIDKSQEIIEIDSKNIKNQNEVNKEVKEIKSVNTRTSKQIDKSKSELVNNNNNQNNSGNNKNSKKIEMALKESANQKQEQETERDHEKYQNYHQQIEDDDDGVSESTEIIAAVEVPANINAVIAEDGPATYSNEGIIKEKVKPDPSTLVEIENSLLSLFNMKRPPKIDRSKIIIPDAMKQLYAQIMGHELDSVNIPKPGILTRSANTVRSFTHKDSKIDDRFPHHHRFRLHFDVKSIPGEEKLKAAELHLTRDAIGQATLHPRQAQRVRYQVLVYDITRVGIRGKREPNYLLLDSKTVRLNSTETVSLDVHPAVDRWLATPQRNYGLLVEVRTMRSLKPAPHHHVRLRRSTDESHENWQHKQPLLFTYTDDGRHKSRSIRDVSSRSKRAGGHHRRPYRRKNNEEICRRHSLYVDFADVGWSDWIVAPPGYDAFYCHGKCSFPLADHLNSTNHAVVQTLVNNLSPGKVPKACCVPTQLEGISMLYLNDQSTVVLKNYQDMTVVGCGCR